MASINNKVDARGPFTYVEHKAGATISPGMLIEVVNDTGVPEVQAHSTAGGFAEKMFAKEDALQGNATDTNYAAGDMVQGCIAGPGAIVVALLLAGSNYTVGTQLISDGAGRLKPTTGTPVTLIGIIYEALDLSASAAVNTLHPVRIQ